MSLNFHCNCYPLFDWLMLAQMGFFLQCTYWFYFSFTKSTRYYWYVKYLMLPEYCLQRSGHFTARYPQLMGMGIFTVAKPTESTPDDVMLMYSLCMGYDPSAMGSQMLSCVHTVGAVEDVVCHRDLLMAALNGASFGCPERLVSYTLVEAIFLPNVLPDVISLAQGVRHAASLLPLVEFTLPGVPFPISS